MTEKERLEKDIEQNIEYVNDMVNRAKRWLKDINRRDNLRKNHMSILTIGYSQEYDDTLRSSAITIFEAAESLHRFNAQYIDDYIKLVREN